MAQFEQGGLFGNERILVKDESISDSINESSADDNSDYESIITNILEETKERKDMYTNKNARDTRF